MGAQKMNKQQADHAIEMVKQGMSCNSVAKYYGVSRQYIHQLCKKGFKLRKFWHGKRPGSMSREELDEHDKARYLTATAIRLGVLIPEPCEICGVFGKNEKGQRAVHAHHDDYNKPLEIRWLCEKHHYEWHKNNKPVKYLLT